MGNRPQIYDKLIKFRDRGVPLTQIQILTKLYVFTGRTIPSSKIVGVKGKDGKILPPDDIVDEPHYIHSLFKGVYKPAGSKYAQCIMLSPKSKWDLEIDREHPTIKINYDFKDAAKYKNQMNNLKNCYDMGLPVGVLFRIKSNVYKVLGLGKVTSVIDTTFVLESYGLSDETSASLKESTLSDYDRMHYGQDIEKIPKSDTENLIRIFEPPPLQKPYHNKSTQITTLSLLEHCENGAWVIPDFQRFYDWDKTMVKNLLSSIFQGYYVGILLLWKLPKESQIGIKPIRGVSTSLDNLAKCHIILDGQQRVTSLYYAIKSPKFPLAGDKSRSFFYIDFAEFFSSNKPEEIVKVFSKKLDPEDCFQKLLFPFDQLYESTDWINDLGDFLDRSYDLDFKDKIKPVCDSITKKLEFIKSQFQISYIVLEDIPFHDVINVFERINTTGKQLDSFDLLIARISIHGINLRELWESACAEYPKISEYFDKPRGSTKGLVIFQTMALCYTKSRSCKHDDILKIFKESSKNKEDFINKWNQALEDVSNAIDHLELISDRGFGVISRRWIPFEPMIPVVASLFRLIETEHTNNLKSCYEKLEQWYWISVFSNTYSSGATTQKTSDYNLVEKWLRTNKTPEPFKKFQVDFDHILNLSQVTSTRSSVFRGILSLLTLAGAKDWDTNAPILTQRAFKKFKVNVDHIFPKSKYKNEPFNESILNKTWLYDRTNKKLKRAKIPFTFINETISKNFTNSDEFKKTLETHFINEKAYDALIHDDHEAFVYEREKTILKEIARKIGSTKTEFHSSVMPLDNIDPFSTDNVPGVA